MSSNNNFKETFLTKKGDDVTIGEDSTDTMVINSNAEFNSQTTFNSQINMGGPIIPTINDQFDIGSAEYKVRDLYLSSNSLHIGDITLSEDIDEVNNERNIKIKTGDGTENEFKLAKLDTQGRLPEDKMPNGLLNSDGKIDKSSIDPTLSLNDLSNVDTTTGVEDGKALVYSSGTWKPGTVATSGGASALNDLTDVSVSGASNGQSLVYNSTSGDWEPGTVSGFTQEQALAGAGGTAAFTPYGIYLTTYITTEANNTLGYFHTDHGISKLFDNNLNEQGCFLKNDNNFPVSFAIDFNTPQIITKYRIWPRATSAERDDEAPSSWEIRASDTKALYDGGSYTILDSQSGLVETDWDQTIVYTSGGTETASNNLSKSNEYHLSSIGAYRYYVLYITNNCGNSNSVGLGEWGLYGGGFTLPSQVGNAGKYLKTDGTALEWAEVSGGGGGTSVTAHTDTQTGDEDYLSALTVGNTKYKIGTSVQNISYTSYSDSSKLHLSFPFQKASSSADALVNQVDGVDATTYNTTFTEGTGFVYDTSVDYDDYSEIDVTGSISGNFSIYMRYYVTSSSPNYQMLLEAYDGDSNTTSLYTNIYWISTNNLMKFAYNNTSNVRNELETNAFVPGRWYNVCVVYNDNITTVYTDEDSYGVMKNMNTATNSNTQNITKIRLGGVTGLNTGGKTLRGKISDFYVFKTALSAFDVQGWANYINNNYITPGFPAPLKFLADVSDTTPQTGDSLVYSGISNKWQPQRAASQFGLPAGDNAKLWVVAGESISRVGGFEIEHVGTGRTFNYDGDGHLYLSNPTGVTPVYLKISNSSAAVHPHSSFTVAVVIDFDSSTSGHRSYIWAQASTSDNDLQYASPHLTYSHNNDQLVLDYYRDANSSSVPFQTNTNIGLHGKILLVVTRESTNGEEDSSATVTFYNNGNQIHQINGTDTLNTSGSNPPHSLNTDIVILTGEPNQDGFHGNHKFYATAVWDRVLTTDEINQLTIDKLVSKRQTLPFYQISDNTPIDGQNLVYSSSTGQYEPKHASPTEIESQLCGGSLGTNDITTGWPRASTVYGNANGTTYPDRLFDNIVTHQYTEQAGWTSLFDYSSVNNYSKVWNDSTEQYDSANSTHANGEDQLQMRFNQPRTITKIMMLWRQGVPFQFPKALRIFGSNTQPSAVSSHAGMNLLFQTDGTGYSQPQITTYTGTAQDNLNIAIPFVIPEAKQGAYQYYTIQIDDLWYATGTHLSISEMFFFHKTQNYRNYQYQMTHQSDTTSLNTSTFVVVNGLSISITPTSSNTKIRIRMVIRGESTENGSNIIWGLQRTSGGTNTQIFTGGSDNRETLAVFRSGHTSANYDETMDSWEIIYVDDVNNTSLDSLTYVPIAKDKLASTFHINETTTDNGNPEDGMSFVEAEEILTGPPLTVNNVAISTTPMVGDSLVYDGSVWKSGFAELLQSVSRIGAGYGPPEGFINENTGSSGSDPIRGSPPPLGQSAVFVPTQYQSNCQINGFSSILFDNLTNNFALFDSGGSYTIGPTTSRPYVLDIWIDVPKVVTQYAIYLPPSGSNLPYGRDWQFQVYNPVTTSWVTLDTATGFTGTYPSVPPSQQTSGYYDASVSTSILSRGYRLYFTQANTAPNGTYMQFGEIGMTFKQPTSVTKVNVTGTPTAGDLLQYDGNIWTPLTIQPTMVVLAGEGVGNLVSTNDYGRFIDRDTFTLTVSHMYIPGITPPPPPDYDANHGYTANGLCDNVVSDSSHPQVFTAVNTGSTNTTADFTYNFKQPVLANHFKAWPHPYTNGQPRIGAFVIYGSNDNSTWSSLGSQTWTSSDYGFLGGTYTASEKRNLTASFDFNTGKQSYQYYKISVSTNESGDNVSDSYLYIGEMALYMMGNGFQFLEERIRNIERVLNVT